MISKPRTLSFLATLAAAAMAPLAATAAAPEAASGVLVVNVDGFRNADGRARVAVFSRQEGFPDSESGAFRAAVVEIKGGRVQVRFDHLPYGEYAVAMYHDENGDARFNKGAFGIPKEGYGVSNNVVHRLRAPDFTEARFVLASGVQETTIHVHY
jgi:uncharacterized protein (DUF2141 family)